ncbi:MAG: right-handed parallel beta-helix repeat-containing protein [Phycisphaerae bacterium]|jgi:hypothetical protein|nr:right-handed parallel beta-helix repeat-containing protein [Phycisphaerae bacterium]
MDLIRWTVRLVLVGALLHPCEAAEYSVAPGESLQAAVKRASAGDTITIRGGRYHQQTRIAGLKGTKDRPITIRAFPGEKVLFDGTVEISGPWKRYKGNIYKTAVKSDVWQLFVGGEMMIPARWPDAFLHDDSIWDMEGSRAQGDPTSPNGTLRDKPVGKRGLAASGFDADGAVAILNVGSWMTYARKVTGHEPGSGGFAYKKAPVFRPKHHYYYLEGKLDLLDAEREWFYDRDAGALYLWAPGGKAPGKAVRGKTQSYAIDAQDCSYVRLQGLKFFGTTFRFRESTNVTVEDCDLSFPSCSKRMLGVLGRPDATLITAPRSTRGGCGNAVVNCSIRDTDSHAIEMSGDGGLIENCCFRNIDFTVSDLPGLMVSIVMRGRGNVFRRNTVDKCGASSTISAGNAPIVELNRVSRTGYLQTDGSITQLTIGAQTGAQVRYNWFHDTVKSGARFDAPIPPRRWGHGGSMTNNVIWNAGLALMFKGERHFCYHNTAFDCRSGITVLDDSRQNGGANEGTITRNNAGDLVSGHRRRNVKIRGRCDHNWNGADKGKRLAGELRDSANLDFRPRSGSELIDSGIAVKGVTGRVVGEAPDIGAYEAGAKRYWIPGRQTARASTAIPCDSSKTARTNADLMFLGGYKAVRHAVYFGRTADKLVRKAILTDSNIFSPGQLQPGAKYYWRVDAIGPDGEVTSGTLWRFETAPKTRTSSRQ